MEVTMNIKMFFGGLTGLTIGSITGLLAFDSVISGLAIGTPMAIGIFGVLIAYRYEQD